ncbi:nipped-B protein [Anabrus simplex]|uniref:nipped-B protein n=1 Tax=Anabrus simplex TaxID=316456 RepID=UPI0035A318F1
MALSPENAAKGYGISGGWNPDLSEVLFLCDNLAYFHYEILDEPLFIIRHIDVILSTVGYDLKKDFEEALLEPIPGPGMSDQINNVNDEETDEGEEDEETLLCRVPENTTLLQKCVIGFQRCSLLINLKHHLMLMYGIGKVKLTMYSPEKPLKDFEKLFCRRTHSKYNPEFVLRKLQKDASCEESHRALIKQYMKFKTVMLEYDDISDDGVSKKELSSTTYHEEQCISKVSEADEISHKTRSHNPKRNKKHKFRSEIKKRRNRRL